MPRRLRPMAGKGSPVRYLKADVDAYLASSGQSRSADAAPEFRHQPNERAVRPIS